MYQETTDITDVYLYAFVKSNLCKWVLVHGGRCSVDKK